MLFQSIGFLRLRLFQLEIVIEDDKIKSVSIENEVGVMDHSSTLSLSCTCLIFFLKNSPLGAYAVSSPAGRFTHWTTTLSEWLWMQIPY